MNDEQRAVWRAIVGPGGDGSRPLERMLEGCPRITREAGDHLVRAGEPAPYVYFLHRGLVQLYQRNGAGRVFTKAFHREGAFTGAHAAAVTGQRSTFSIRALEGLVATRIRFAAIDAVAERDPTVQRFLRRAAEQLAWFKERREASLLTLSATERYERLLREEPWLPDRVLQRDLATYLGVTEVSLSRIRGRMKRAEKSA